MRSYRTVPQNVSAEHLQSALLRHRGRDVRRIGWQPRLRVDSRAFARALSLA